MNRFEIVSKSEQETINMAKHIAPYFELGDVLLLDGDLGTGKTQFVKGFTDARGSSDGVTSPTFTIAQFYNIAQGSLLHIDTYRLADINEFRDTGLADYFSQSIVLIEWGSKIMDEFDSYFLIEFANVAADKDHRRLTFSYVGADFAEKFTLLSQKLANI
jgi:tRNA threonylcarbamoyladenosine biosynthesis protein TsaE